MANHVSALKRVRQTAKKTEVNRNNRSRVRGALRKMREVAAAGDKKAADCSSARLFPRWTRRSRRVCCTRIRPDVIRAGWRLA